MPRAASPRRRWDLAVLAAILLGPALALLAWGIARQQVSDLEDRLVRDANALAARTYRRPVHAPPVRDGTFGDAVVRHLPPFQAEADSGKRDDAGGKRLGEVAAGEAPVSALPDRWRRALERLGPDLDGLLAGTHAARADLPPDRLFATPDRSGRWDGYQLAAKLAAVRTRLALARGDAGSALRDCLDALALGRDAGIAAGLVGRMVDAAIVSRLAPACAAAIGATPPPALPGAIGGVRAIRDATPTVAAMLRDDLVSSEALAFGRDPAVEQRLTPAAQALFEGDRVAAAAWERLARRDGWRVLRHGFDGLVAAAGTPPPDRDAAFARVQATAARSLNPLAAIALPDVAKYLRRADAAALRLDALVLAAAAASHREASGAWPRSVEALAAEGRLSRAEAARLAPVSLVLRPDGALELRAPLPARPNDPPESLALAVPLRAR